MKRTGYREEERGGHWASDITELEAGPVLLSGYPIEVVGVASPSEGTEVRGRVAASASQATRRRACFCADIWLK